MTPTGVRTLVVGAGPAGLFAALGILNAGEHDVLVIDAGHDVEERSRVHTRGGSNLVSGVGGAGLFSDGKLCMSLDVGGALPAKLSEPKRQSVLASIAEAFDVSVVELPRLSMAERVAHAARQGLEFTFYPVEHIGTEHCTRRIVELRRRVSERGGAIRPDAELVDLRRDGSGFLATVRTQRRMLTIRAACVVLAMGKVGSYREAELCERLGATAHAVPMYVGVRLELPRAAASALFAGVRDPKYKMPFADGTKMKLHCAADGGGVLALRYEGLPLAGGHSYRDTKTERTSFAVLWDGLRVANDPYGAALTIMRRSAELAHGRLLVQRLSDYRRRQASTNRAIAAAGPSCEAAEWAAGDLRDALPNEYWDKFDEFLSALGQLVPPLCDEQAVMFGPAIEWWTRRIETDEFLQSSTRGLFVAGDGAGWSQGIVHAAATGLIAAEGVVGRLQSLATGAFHDVARS